MWHEARRREKATQKLFSDYKKRAEKRREEDRVKPSSLLQINGLKAKLHLDSSTHKQAANCLVAWQGDKNITIDRFDVRATLSSIPTEVESGRLGPSSSSATRDSQVNNQPVKFKSSTAMDADECEPMRKLLNYERYRLVIHSECNKISEELRLKLIAKMDFMSDAKMRKLKYNTFGTLGETSLQQNPVESAFGSLSAGGRKPMLPGIGKGATIGYNYGGSAPMLPQTRINQQEVAEQEDTSTRGLSIEDLDKFELDEVNLAALDTDQLAEQAAKYELTAEELSFLAKRDTEETDSRHMIKLLMAVAEREREKGRREREKEAKSKSLDRRNFYGPALPPEMLAAKAADRSPSNSDDDDNSHSQQRSPSGCHIPMRPTSVPEPTDAVELSQATLVKARSSPPVSSGPAHYSHQQSTVKVELPAAPASPSNKPTVLETVLEKISRDKSAASAHQDRLVAKCERLLPTASREPVKSHHHAPRLVDEVVALSPRRASTPLIYKRNCRSSRSLSREKSRYHASSSMAATHFRSRSRSSRSYSSSGLSSGSSAIGDGESTPSRRATYRRSRYSGLRRTGQQASRSRSISRSSSVSSSSYSMRVGSHRHRVGSSSTSARRTGTAVARSRGGRKPRRRRRGRRNRRR